MNNYMFDTINFLAQSGVEDAMKEISSYILSPGRHTVSDEQAEMVMRYLNSLAEKNDHHALLSLGALYYTGLGNAVPQDYKKALYYYEKAAEESELKNHWALNNLGYCYYYGRAGAVDYKKAYSCFASSAMYGNANAMYKLGDMYYYGNFVEKDIDASFYWYSEAKKATTYADDDYQGFLVASIAMRLGRAYLYGEGVECDMIRALSELRSAEILFYKQLQIGDEFSRGQLPKAQELIKVAQDRLNEQVGIL